jgi:serine protease AprX
VAPGKSIISLRSPGSYIDQMFSFGRVGTRYFRGSGTSQSAAVTSGAVALLLQQRPNLSPDQVKWLLKKWAQPMPLEPSKGKGAGMLNIYRAINGATPTSGYQQSFPRAMGTGSLELARGSAHVSDGGVVLEGEMDIMGRVWDPDLFVAAMENDTAWDGGSFLGEPLTGDVLGSTGENGFTGRSWTGRSWTGRSWSGDEWLGRSWTGRSWSGSGWSSGDWSSTTWAGSDWTSNAWSSALWGH